MYNFSGGHAVYINVRFVDAIELADMLGSNSKSINQSINQSIVFNSGNEAHKNHNTNNLQTTNIKRNRRN